MKFTLLQNLRTVYISIDEKIATVSNPQAPKAVVSGCSKFKYLLLEETKEERSFLFVFDSN